MPHIIVKIAIGRSEAEKKKLAEEITKAVMNVTIAEADFVSVSIHEVVKEDWKEQVYKPDILEHWDKLYKEPNYNID